MKKRISVLCAALFCAAAPAQEAGAPAAGQTAAADAPQIQSAQPTPATADVQPPVEPEKTETAAVQDTAKTAPPVAAVPAPAPPLTRADSALSIYRAARDSIIAANRRFPRPPRLRRKQDADTVKAQRTPDSALASADETLRAAWAAMGVTRQPLTQPDTVKTAAAPPREPETQARAGAPEAKPFRAQTALGAIVPLTRLKPWWNMGYHASYRGIDTDARFSNGLGADLSLYTPDKKEYKKYREGKGEEIDNISAASMFIVDLGYYLKFYPANTFKIPYITGAAGICGAFGGGVTYDSLFYNRTSKEDDSKEIRDDLIDDIYMFYASAGAGVDVPAYAGIRLFAEIQYMLRYGLFSIGASGGFVSQIPVRLGVIVPLGAF